MSRYTDCTAIAAMSPPMHAAAAYDHHERRAGAVVISDVIRIGDGAGCEAVKALTRSISFARAPADGVIGSSAPAAYESSRSWH
jgi:hypothetical protein